MTNETKAQSLHDQIMRLPCDPAEYANVNMMLAYKSGHHDARHSAAELAAAYEADAQQGAPVAVPDDFPPAFITTESGSGSYKLVMSFESLRDMHAAHDRILSMLSAAPPPPAQKPVAVKPTAVVWIDAHHLVDDNGPSLIRDVALVSAERSSDSQIALCLIDKAPVLRHPVSRDGMQPVGHFIRRSRFGPHIEVDPDEKGAYPLYAAPPAQQSQSSTYPRRLTEKMKEAGQRAIERAHEDGCFGLHSLGYAYAEAALDAADDGDTAAPEQAEQPHQVNRSVIRDVFLRNGFAIKEGHSDLKPYVYAAAEELLALDGKEVVTEQDAVKVPRELLECYLNGGGDWVEAGHKLRDLLGGGE